MKPRTNRLNSSGVSSKGRWPAPSMSASWHCGKARFRFSAERTSTAPSRVPQINRDRALIFGTAACNAFTSFSQLRKVFRMLCTLPGRMICERYPSTVPVGRRRGSPYIRATAMRNSGRETGQATRRSDAPIRPFKKRIRPEPRFDQGLTGAASTRDRTFALREARNIAIAPPHEHPTTSTSSSLRRSSRARTRPA